MIKAIILILFAMGSSSALAQIHVPGGGPVGSPGNPGTYQPPYGGNNHGGGYGHDDHNGGYGHDGHDGDNHNGGYHPQPNPYPVPAPMPVLGPCVINQMYNGGQTYEVLDGRGNYVTSTYDYNQALQTAEQYDQMGYCRGVKINVQNQNPYPQPQPQQNFCRVMPGRDAYGNEFDRVLDRAGRILLTTASYAQAVQFSQTDARCFQP